MQRILHVDTDLTHHLLTVSQVKKINPEIYFIRSDSVDIDSSNIETTQCDCILTDLHSVADLGDFYNMLPEDLKNVTMIVLLDPDQTVEDYTIPEGLNLETVHFGNYENLCKAFESCLENEKSKDISQFAHLTPREREILALLANGNSNKVIAQELDISYRTVLNHVNNLFRKLDINNRLEAAHLAIKHGLVEVN